MLAPESAAVDTTPATPPPSIEETVGTKGVEVAKESAAPSEDNELSAALKDYNALVNVAMDEYKKEKSSLKQRELWEGIINGVGMIAAGMYGLKTGTDMGGVKLSPTDWAAKIQGARAELSSSLGQAGRTFSIRKGIGEEVNRRNQQLWNRGFQEAREKRLAEQYSEEMGSKIAQAAAKTKQADNKANEKASAAQTKEVKSLEKDINKSIEKYANPKATDEQKELYMKQIQSLNEKYKAITGKDMASTEKVPKWFGLSDRNPTPTEMLGGGGEGMDSPPPSDNGDVMMTSPDGKQYKIPAANVQKALQGGWKKV
jgi:hypothetical protein